jgi:hypothetical protein
MAGKNPLLVAKQHGHGVNTMLEVYAAWIEGAKESDVEAIRRAMESGSPVPGRTRVLASSEAGVRTKIAAEVE